MSAELTLFPKITYQSLDDLLRFENPTSSPDDDAIPPRVDASHFGPLEDLRSGSSG